MLLKDDVTTIVQMWGLPPLPAGPATGLASHGQFSTQLLRAVFDPRKSGQTRRFCNREGTVGKRWMLIEAEKRTGCA